MSMLLLSEISQKITKIPREMLKTRLRDYRTNREE